MVENIVKKGEIAFNKQFSPFLTILSTAIYLYISLMRQNAALCGNGLTGNKSLNLRSI